MQGGVGGRHASPVPLGAGRAEVQSTGILTKGEQLFVGQKALLAACELAWWPLWQQPQGPRWERVVPPRPAPGWEVKPLEAEQLQKLIQFTLDTFGGLDVLVSNAAVNPASGPIMTMEVSWRQLAQRDAQHRSRALLCLECLSPASSYCCFVELSLCFTGFVVLLLC